MAPQMKNNFASLRSLFKNLTKIFFYLNRYFVIRIYGYYKKHYFSAGLCFTREQYVNVNGYSNLYSGWGKEDDDIRNRLNFKLYAKLNKKIIKKDLLEYWPSTKNL